MSVGLFGVCDSTGFQKGLRTVPMGVALTVSAPLLINELCCVLLVPDPQLYFSLTVPMP